MELNVQFFLRNTGTLDDLASQFGIKASEKGNLVVLNYDQIESPKTHPIVMECRQLVLEKGTWDIVHMSFRRFFNYGEALELNGDFDFSNAFALDKIDGSIIGVFRYGGEWHMTTRGVIDGDCQVGTFPLTFKQLFDMVVAQYPDFYDHLYEEYCYTFELTSPENRVVTPYTDRALHLLTVRDKRNEFKELDWQMTNVLAKFLGVQRPAWHSFKDIADLVRMAANVGELNEGFVCMSDRTVNGEYRRIKVKNPAYLAVAHLKESAACSLRGLLYVVMIGEADEFLSYFPEYKEYMDGLREKWNEFKTAVEADLKEAESKKELSRKEFALWAKTRTNSSILFMYLDGSIKTLSDWIDLQITNRGEKNFGKTMMNTLKVNDMEWENQA